MEKKQNNENSLRMMTSLFRHIFRGREMTYIFIIDSNNEIKRARVPIKNGLPQIKKSIKWESFSYL